MIDINPWGPAGGLHQPSSLSHCLFSCGDRPAPPNLNPPGGLAVWGGLAWRTRPTFFIVTVLYIQYGTGMVGYVLPRISEAGLRRGRPDNGKGPCDRVLAGPWERVLGPRAGA